jgi:putative ribosome biogenesis GTPase RsgA
VKTALGNGEIAESRYKNYLNMLLEEEDNFRTNDY